MATAVDLHGPSPLALTKARHIAHKAAQLLTMAARANLAAQPDDSHSNLGWERAEGQFVSQPLDTDYAVGLTLSPLRLSAGRTSGPTEVLDLDGETVGDAEAWLDAQLLNAGLQPASAIVLPYDLPAGAATIEIYSASAEAKALQTLSNWFDLAHDAISALIADIDDVAPGPSPLRCWPHHFDIATYVALETGDAETARGIGVGLSPGDEDYDQPYFYINPWPHLDPANLPDAPTPGHWHTVNYVGLIATAKEVLSLPNISHDLPLFVSQAFGIGRQQLGA